VKSISDRLIVLSSPKFPAEEHRILQQLFEAGLTRLHVRKPGISVEHLQVWLAKIPPQYHPRLVLHQHWELGKVFKLGGLHAKEAVRKAWKPKEAESWWTKSREQGWILSSSVHELSDLPTLPKLDYVFLSPVFESISKPGYGPKSSLRVEKKYPFEVFGLGGITAENAAAVFARGFDGIAILGDIWQEPERALAQFRRYGSEVR
jgi:thiamine-phosphate pyrophosphorylase